ncbi:MAG: phosphoglycerate dehydrogenase, partial [Dehalococcoidia bacterium]|nr:phosphoglycerate dehydrogenase [Dehalococcoidia bacterium]
MAKILVADPIAEDGIQALKKCFEVDVKIGLAPQALLDVIGDYEALVVRSETKVTSAVIERGCKLQVIGRAGVGVDNIDIDAATRCGIIVVNAPAANTTSTAEHTIAMMMALARHIPQAHAALKAGQWQRQKFVGTEIRGKILGVVGLGKVGTEVARRARGLEMKVMAFDPFVSTEYARNLGIELVPLERIFKDSDFITVHTPLTADTKGIIGAKEIAMMKPSVKLINVARGGIIDEAVLYQALEQGKVAGAAIDVFSKEPAQDNILVKSDKVIVTPHLGASTNEAQSNVALDVAEQIIAALQGQPTRYAVNIPFISAESVSILAPYQVVASHVGEVAAQLIEGQLGTIAIQYDGEISNFDTSVLKAVILRAILGKISEERVNIVNANVIAASRG